jgi:hypothetical protein
MSSLLPMSDVSPIAMAKPMESPETALALPSLALSIYNVNITNCISI